MSSMKSKLSLIDEKADADASKSSIHTASRSEPGEGLLQSMNSDLQLTIRDQQVRMHDQDQSIKSQRTVIEDLKEETQLLQSQVWTFSAQLTQVQREADNLRGSSASYDEQMQALNMHLQGAKRTINEQVQELAARSSTIQVLSGHNQKLQSRVTDLESLVAVASRDTGNDFQTLFDHYSEMKKEHDDMTLKLKAEEELRLAMDELVLPLQSENASLKTVIDELQKEASGLEICQPQTLRSLLTLRLVEQTWNIQPTDGASEEVGQTQRWLPEGLSERSFDKICSPGEIQSLATLLPKGQPYKSFYERLRLTVCSLCSKAKFSFRSDQHPKFQAMKWLNEYLGNTKYFPCCYEQVCKECFKNHLLDTLESKWWYKLGTLQWFPCPREGCDAALGIRCEADLEICLERICDTEAEEHTKRQGYLSHFMKPPLTEHQDMSRHLLFDKLLPRSIPGQMIACSGKQQNFIRS